MQIYGADFSGATDASKGIYYTAGILRQRTLTIKETIHCDDRLDLFAAILRSTAPWGLDFPFSYPLAVLEQLELTSWPLLLQFAADTERREYLDLLESHICTQESRCGGGLKCCRHTDTAVSAFSPVKRVNPNMRSMTYSGLKFLRHLHLQGIPVYPFDHRHGNGPRIYEVYPSHTWRLAGMKRSVDMSAFCAAFNRLGMIKLVFNGTMPRNQDAMDSLVACVTMAASVSIHLIDKDWDILSDCFNADEKTHRHVEGLIVRI